MTARAWPRAPPPRDAALPAESSGAGFGCAPGLWKLPGRCVRLQKGKAAPQPRPRRAPRGQKRRDRIASPPQEPRPSAAPWRQSRRRSPQRGSAGTKVPAEHPRGDTAPVVPAGSSAHPAGSAAAGLGSGVTSEGSPGTPRLLSFYGYRFPAESLWLHVVSGAVVGDSRGQQMLWQRSSRQPWDVFCRSCPPAMLRAGGTVVGCHWPPRCLKTQSLEMFFHRVTLRFTSRGHSLGQASLERVRFPPGRSHSG